MTEKIRLLPITPGDLLLHEFMQPMGISIDKLAHDIDLDVSQVSDILKAKQDITEDIATRLGQYFNSSKEMWTNLQAHYELKLLLNKWPQLEDYIKNSARFK
jgi:addiction module HigA family antidote